MIINDKDIIGSLVAANYKTAEIFKKYGIDFCCGGNISIKKASAEYKVDKNALLAELNEVISKKDIESDLLLKLNPDALIDHIIEQHHSYIRQNTKNIPPYLEKLIKTHGANHTELKEVQRLFLEASKALNQHINEEEEKLFPLIKKLVTTYQKEGKTAYNEVREIKHTINKMLVDHDAEGERFRTISKLTNNYKLPKDLKKKYAIKSI